MSKVGRPPKSAPIPEVNIEDLDLHALHNHVLQQAQDDKWLRRAWEESEVQYNRQRELELRQEWAAHHRRLLESFAHFSEEHAQKAAALERVGEGGA